MPNLFSRLLSRGADKQLKEIEKIAAGVNQYEAQYKDLTDEELLGKTEEFRRRYAEATEERGLSREDALNELLPEAFAAVRESAGRQVGMRHFEVQLQGGVALHKGMIAEMKTGEGKTLVSTLAGYLNAIPGDGVHIVTVNDYLAKRDSEWMGRIYRGLGMEVGLIQNGMRGPERRRNYECDVTYGTNSEFGFDYLRDNMVMSAEQRVQRGHAFAIVDEVDSILIDEARTPLIISGAGSRAAGTYRDFARAVKGLTADVDYEMDEAKNTIAATDTGLKKIEAALGLDIYDDLTGTLVNHLQQALKAEYMFHCDQQYVVVDHEVKIVDEFTGRIMEGRRYSEGLHQAIEAKEASKGVRVREENQTLATITLQNYFRLYDKLSGMTGTAMTEDAEFREIYGLAVQAITPNKPVIRVDHDDLVYQTIDAKFNAVADDVQRRHAKGQPVLVGTVTIESSERLSRTLNKRGIKHEVLNAKFHEREAQIIAQAGRKGAVTIATNMAGRGTDILLGGNPDIMADDFIAEAGIEEPTEEQRREALAKAREICANEREDVLEAGGLCVIGTERHESRRIDNQLRGRSGRQGDPGETQFYLSLDDDLMRLFAGDRMDRIAAMMSRAEMPADMPIQSKMVTKAVESAQRKVEEINFSMRKNVLDYDDVMNMQRQVIYEERNKILDGKDLLGHITEVAQDVVQRHVAVYCPEHVDTSEWDIDGLVKWISQLLNQHDESWADDLAGMEDQGAATDYVDALVMDSYGKLDELFGEGLRAYSKNAMLRVIDTRWRTYLQEMDYLKTGIGLRGFGQRDPLVEYKAEAYSAFSQLVDAMYESFLGLIFRLKPATIEHAAVQQQGDSLSNASYSGPRDVDGDQGAASVTRRTPATAGGESQAAIGKPATYRKDESADPGANLGRNDPCWCGSGKKYKNCHGRNGGNGGN